MEDKSNDVFRVTLLGTGAPPPVLHRFGPSTLVEAGGEKFLFDAGRGALQRLHQLGIPFGDITGMFLTHHHSDHVVGFTDLWLTGWIGRPWGRRTVPLKVWGPEGTNQMAEHLPLAFATDIRVRSHSYNADGVKLESTEIEEGVVFESGGVRVTAFRVDHGGEQLDAFGYRIDCNSRSAVLSGDTTFNENLMAHSQDVDLLVHEVTHGMGEGLERSNLERIRRNHTTPEDAGKVFTRTRPRLAVYNHILLFGEATDADLIPATRTAYSGPLVLGEDLMRFDIGDEVRCSGFPSSSDTNTASTSPPA
ncbi:MAG: MBL fold metallo-hydrolase [Deltaproteobacteria bacterium]|nr:MBL fold metallo-hydrolase [Deltaproteobacteria bacterium]